MIIFFPVLLLKDTVDILEYDLKYIFYDEIMSIGQ